eukprot:TRINITY_DN49889_c0_g1_i1.p1 TRINITY_DN49889_c0_g1~~TRINITY_DN49889_c0_g1_i1.p1  ORF type:complete len:525 (-),score=127.19 TRINITY_DN49889_c0_g1_i1:129-1703(-)
MIVFVFFFQAEDGIRDAQESRGLGDVYKRQVVVPAVACAVFMAVVFPAARIVQIPYSCHPERCAQPEADVVPALTFDGKCDGQHLPASNQCWMDKAQQVRAWFDETWSPPDCGTAKIVLVPPQNFGGVGSELNTLTSILILARELGYTPVPVNSLTKPHRWHFSGGCDGGMATFECEFQPLGRCSTPEVRAARLRWARPAFSAKEFQSLAYWGYRTVYLHRLDAANLSLKLSVVPAMAARLGVPLQIFYSQALSHIVRPREPLQHRIDQTLAGIRDATHGQRASSVGLHIRGAEFNDGRVQVPLARYFEEVDRIANELPADPSRLVVATVTDMHDLNASVVQREVGAKPYKVIFPTKARLLAPGVEVATAARLGNAVSAAGEGVTPRALLRDAIVDLMILVEADYFLGTSSNWVFVALSLRLAADPNGKYAQSAIVMNGVEWRVPPPGKPPAAIYKPYHGESSYKIQVDYTKVAPHGVHSDVPDVDASTTEVWHRLPLLNVFDERLIEYWNSCLLYTSPSPRDS